MQIDFHFYTIYALARAAGFVPDNAFVVAYASQHTDDAKYDKALEFQNGGRFQQVLTAHRFFDLKALDKKTSYRIWIPFHFLPGNLGVEFYERMVTRPRSTVAQRLVDDLLSSNSRPYLLHRLGIFLHCYADTWSHQNFLGLERDDLNDVKRLSVKDLEKPSFKSFLEKLKEDILEYAAPKLGHAQAGTFAEERPCPEPTAGSPERSRRGRRTGRQGIGELADGSGDRSGPSGPLLPFLACPLPEALDAFFTFAEGDPLA